MQKNSKIVVFGGTGLVGSAILRKLLEKRYTNIIGTCHTKKTELFLINNKLTINNHQLTTNNKIKWYQIDLTDQQAVAEFFREHKPEYVFLAAAKVGGIWANNVYRADFIYQNLQIQNNVIHNAYKYGVKKLMFLGSTCIYPKNCPQPIKEEYLLTGELEYTNEPYAIAKIAGIKMCESYNLQYGTNFISVMPTNLYGPNDNFDLEKSHVLPALIRKIHLGKCLEENNWEEIKRDLNKNPIEGINGESDKEEILKILEKYGIKIINDTDNKLTKTNNKLTKTNNKLTSTNFVSIEIWGTGKPKREFLWSDDMADACVFIMEKVNFKDLVNFQLTKTNNELTSTNNKLTEVRNTHINIGTGKDISIRDLAYLIKDVIGFKGEFYFNTSKPDGTFRKVTDVSKLHSLGWKHKVALEEGIRKLYEWYMKE